MQSIFRQAKRGHLVAKECKDGTHNWYRRTSRGRLQFKHNSSGDKYPHAEVNKKNF